MEHPQYHPARRMVSLKKAVPKTIVMLQVETIKLKLTQNVKNSTVHPSSQMQQQMPNHLD
jgi:hypothetical protein